jgi:hypothetical protein
MLEAAIVDLVFTISLKRSTLNRQLSTSCPADYPIFGLPAQPVDATLYLEPMRWNFCLRVNLIAESSP